MVTRWLNTIVVFYKKKLIIMYTVVVSGRTKYRMFVVMGTWGPRSYENLGETVSAQGEFAWAIDWNRYTRQSCPSRFFVDVSQCFTQHEITSGGGFKRRYYWSRLRIAMSVVPWPLSPTSQSDCFVSPARFDLERPSLLRFNHLAPRIGAQCICFLELHGAEP